MEAPVTKEEGSHALDVSVPVKSTAVTGYLALAMTATALTAPQVLAHGGGLDSQGCHTNSKTGDRHCHRNGGSTSKLKSDLVTSQALAALKLSAPIT